MINHLEIDLNVKSWLSSEYPSSDGFGDYSEAFICVDLYDENWKLIETEKRKIMVIYFRRYSSIYST